ncbi:MAG: hypothetical protein CMI00_08475 [Oceanospirillaceae bacterium]|nr:hypothetical protein [Oceanospirillaceae bacterium]
MKSMKGFTLIELMIVVAIIGILASVALPAYNQYTAKSKFAEVVAATTAVKTAIDVCYQIEGSIASCDASTTGSGSVKAAQDSAFAGQYVDSVAVADTTAAITAIAISTNGLGGETYILTPTATTGSAAGTLTWVATGSCFAKGFC